MKREQPLFIYITGCDGTGKSTQAELMRRRLAAAGIDAAHLWLRFPFLFSLPLLAYARRRGYSWYEVTGDTRHGYWDFRQSRVLRHLFPWVLLLDAALAAVPRIVLPRRLGKSIVCERFVLDMLVDMSLAFGEEMHLTAPGRLFLRLLPTQARIAILDLDEAAIRQRRAGMEWDRRLAERLAAFRRLAGDLSLPVFPGVSPAADLSEHIWQSIGVAYER